MHTEIYRNTCIEEATLGLLGVDKKLILRRILRKCGVGVYTGFSWLKMVYVAGFV